MAAATMGIGGVGLGHMGGNMVPGSWKPGTRSRARDDTPATSPLIPRSWFEPYTAHSRDAVSGTGFRGAGRAGTSS
jgi:3-hydroxyisobutyrate dehydrogenase-like beta-hydroxyacid dehydrogenase